MTPLVVPVKLRESFGSRLPREDPGLCRKSKLPASYAIRPHHFSQASPRLEADSCPIHFRLLVPLVSVRSNPFIPAEMQRRPH